MVLLEVHQRFKAHFLDELRVSFKIKMIKIFKESRTKTEVNKSRNSRGVFKPCESPVKHIGWSFSQTLLTAMHGQLFSQKAPFWMFDRDSEYASLFFCITNTGFNRPFRNLGIGKIIFCFSKPNCIVYLCSTNYRGDSHGSTATISSESFELRRILSFLKYVKYFILSVLSSTA